MNTNAASPHGQPASGTVPSAADQASALRQIVAALRHSTSGKAGALSPAPGAAASDGKRPARAARVITVASGKGGVGKTNTAVNLSIVLAQNGLRVSLVDADLGVANADVLCGLTPTARVEQVLYEPQPGAASVRTLSDLAIKAPGGFWLVPGSVGIAEIAELAEGQRQRLLDGLMDLERLVDVVVIDAAAGVGSTVMSLVAAADMSIVVATPEPTSIADAYALIKCAFAGRRRGLARPDQLRLLVNQAASAHEATAVHGRIDAVAQRFLNVSVPMLGWLPHDVTLVRAVRRRQPVTLTAPNAPVSAAFRNIGGIVSEQLGLAPTIGSGLVRAEAQSIASATQEPPRPTVRDSRWSWLARLAPRAI